jgi:hypothetical protein
MRYTEQKIERKTKEKIKMPGQTNEMNSIKKKREKQKSL